MLYTDKKIIVTGGTGLLGSEISGEKIGSKDLDLTDQKRTEEFFADKKPDVVVHCAGLVGGVVANMNRKADFFTENMYMNLNVYEACRKAGVKQVISFMSTCIFPEKYASTTELTEDVLLEGFPHETNFGYAYAKRMLHIMNRAYREQYGLNYFSIIPTNLYGKNDNYNLENSHLIPALIRKCYEAEKHGDDFVVWGDGKPVREFVYVEDLANIIHEIIEKDMVIEDDFIVSPDVEHSIKQVALEIADIISFSPEKIAFDSSKPNGQMRKVTNNMLFRKYFPYYEFTQLRDGLMDTIQYYIENKDKLRG